MYSNMFYDIIIDFLVVMHNVYKIIYKYTDKLIYLCNINIYNKNITYSRQNYIDYTISCEDDATMMSAWFYRHHDPPCIQDWRENMPNKLLMSIIARKHQQLIIVRVIFMITEFSVQRIITCKEYGIVAHTKFVKYKGFTPEDILYEIEKIKLLAM